MSGPKFILADMSDIDLDGFIMTSVDGTDPVARAVRETGWWSFEQPMPALFARASQTWPGLFADGGASAGFYSLVHLALAPTHRAIAFEPYEPAFDSLCINAALNLFSDRISVTRTALSSYSGEAQLYVPAPEHGLLETRCSLEADFTHAHQAVVSVPVRPLDFYQAQLGDLSILKLDVEGHEAKALLGARETIAAFRPIIFAGLLSSDLDEVDTLKRRDGYRSLVLSGAVAIEQDTVAHDPGGWNHILAPDEKWAELLDLIETSGVRVQRL